MKNYLAIVRKELHGLFVSPIAYVVLAAFFLVSGYFFYLILFDIIERVQAMAISARQFGMPPQPVDIPSVVFRSYFSVLSTILLFLMPMVTMGMIAEEKKRGTVELLFTSPITNNQLILGKFSAAVLFLAVMLVPSLFNTIVLFRLSEPQPPVGPVFVGYLGALLLGGALLAVGIFISSLTENQIVAGVLTFVFFIILWVIDVVTGPGTSLGSEILKYVSMLNHYEDFTKGILDSQHVVFYLSFMILGLFLTSVSLDSPKWRQ